MMSKEQSPLTAFYVAELIIEFALYVRVVRTKSKMYCSPKMFAPLHGRSDTARIDWEWGRFGNWDGLRNEIRLV